MQRRLLLPALGLALAVGATPLADATTRAHQSFAPAPHRKPANLVNHGWTPKPLRVITFVPSSYPSEKELLAFPDALVHSKWLQEFSRAYSIPSAPPPIGEGFEVDPATLPVLTSSSTVNDLMTFLDQHVDSDLIKQDARYQTIFIMYLPCARPQSLDGFGCVSHHPAIPLENNDTRYTNLDSFAMVEGPVATGVDGRNAATATATHELIEAATDTGPNGWYLRATDKDRPWESASPFVEDEGAGNIEVADHLQGSRWFERYKPAGFANPVRYEYVRAYSPYGNRHRDDPGVPVSPHPYFNVTTARNWYGAARGTVTTIKVRGWSSKLVGADGTWKVTADFTGWLDSSGRGGATAQPNPCSLVKTSWTTHNGGLFELAIKLKGKVSKNTYCVVRLKSAISPTPANGDSSHPWFIGFTPALA